MFQYLKKKTQLSSTFKDLPHPLSYSKSPGVTSSVTKSNEASRLVRCRHCGFICDRERDVRLRDGSYAGYGITQGAQLSASSSVGDRVVPAAGSVQSSVDLYYQRDVRAGCPSCGSFTYDPNMPITHVPD